MVGRDRSPRRSPSKAEAGRARRSCHSTPNVQHLVKRFCVGRWGCEVVFQPYEKRTSLPGSISKSRTNESAVFGLIISSVNFTKMESSRKMAYLSIDSKSIAINEIRAHSLLGDLVLGHSKRGDRVQNNQVPGNLYPRGLDKE